MDRGSVAVVTVCDSFSVSHSLRFNGPTPNKATDSFLNYLQSRFLLNRFRLLSKRFLLLWVVYPSQENQKDTYKAIGEAQPS